MDDEPNKVNILNFVLIILLRKM